MLRAAELREQGWSPQLLLRLYQTGQLQRVSRGLYSLPTGEITEHHTLIEVCQRVPKGVLCLLTALRYHGVGTQQPHTVWLALPEGAQAPALDYPTLRLARLRGEAYSEGVQTVTAHGAPIRIYSVAKFREIAVLAMGDGIAFDLGSVRADAIREEAWYGGSRIKRAAQVGSARCALQIGVTFGDAVIPAPTMAKYPVLLNDFKAPKLRVYPVYSVIAEKYQAMVVPGQANSRMKDFFDRRVIAQRTHLFWPATQVAVARNRATATWDPAQGAWR